MKSIYILLIALIVSYFIITNQNYFNTLDKYTILDDKDTIIDKDKKYLEKFKKKQLVNLTSNNKNDKMVKKNNLISIITFDNRAELPYVITHNENIIAYSKKWGYDYKFYDKCTYNVYWCKIHMVLEKLKT